MTLADQLGSEILDIVPTIMEAIRFEMRRFRRSDLSVPQFRVLAYLQSNPGSTLVAIAESLGLTSPSTCSLVDGLETKGLVTRQADREDRRKVAIDLSPDGSLIYAAASEAARQMLAQRMKDLTLSDQDRLAQGLALLRTIFSPERTSLPTVSGNPAEQPSQH
jgi:DNA-binding MarR family transcriptional regulator